MAVTPTRELRLTSPPTELAVDGGRAATVGLVWTPATGRVAKIRVLCDTRVYDPVVTRDRVGAVCYEDLNAIGYTEADIFGPGRVRNSSLKVDRYDYEANFADESASLDLAGGGSLIVGIVNTATRHELRRIDARGNTLLRSYPRVPTLFNVDETRILVGAAPGRLEVVSAGGKVLAHPQATASEAVLRGDRVVVRSGTRLAVADLTGRVIRRHTLAAGSTLEDFRGGLVVLRRADRLRLLRLSDGRSVTLRLTGQSGEAWGRLDATGLFYAYPRSGGTRGTIAWVAAARLPALLTH